MNIPLQKHKILRKFRRLHRQLNPLSPHPLDECDRCGCVGTAYAAPKGDTLCSNCGFSLGTWDYRGDEEDD